MPDVKVYIRQENLDKWKNIHNKSEWINALLKNSDNTSNYGKTVETPAGPAVNVLNETLEAKPLAKLFTPRTPDPVTGYPCCTKKKPCKHWTWDGISQAYVNQLTGEARLAEI